MIQGTENGIHRYWNMRDSSGDNLHIHSSTKKNAQEANPNEDVKANAEERGIAVSNDTPTELVIETKCLQQKPSRMRMHFLKLQTARC